MDQLLKNILHVLPNDIVGEILSRVGQQSSVHLSVARLVCKDFFEQSEHYLVYRRLSLDRWPILAWGIPEMVYLFYRCVLNKNPNAIFRLGLISYFDRVNTDLGLRYLEEASINGLNQAVYVYGLIMFSSHDLEEKDTGLKILNARFPPLPDLVVSVRMDVYGLLQQLCQDGPRYLKQASNCQLVEAVYVYGLVMFASHDVNEKEIGLKILNQTFPPIPDYVVAVRTKVYDLIHQILRMNRHPFADMETMCPISGHNGYLPRRNGFELKKPECMSCF
ncbi:F-box protein At2g35280-like [Rutidosis leptorrhynchoides]|uniref:F-box protein At2g35280-like n=1 Tax=Rutidosis leptorrhynchoides TaxID=125765 RepID=UPI003A98ED76